MTFIIFKKIPLNKISKKNKKKVLNDDPNVSRMYPNVW